MDRWEQARREYRNERAMHRFTGKRGPIAVLRRLSVAAVVLRTGDLPESRRPRARRPQP